MRVIFFPFINNICNNCVHLRKDVLGVYCNNDKKAPIKKIAECNTYFPKKIFNAIYNEKEDYGDL